MGCTATYWKCEIYFVMQCSWAPLWQRPYAHTDSFLATHSFIYSFVGWLVGCGSRVSSRILLELAIFNDYFTLDRWLISIFRCQFNFFPILIVCCPCVYVCLYFHRCFRPFGLWKHIYLSEWNINRLFLCYILFVRSSAIVIYCRCTFARTIDQVVLCMPLSVCLCVWVSAVCVYVELIFIAYTKISKLPLRS